MGYIIAWKSKITGYEGQGTYQFESLDVIMEECSKMNKKYPEIDHFYKEV